MATTLSTDKFIPEVWAGVLQAQFLGALRIANSAAVVSDDTLVGQAGDTINMPKWRPMSPMQDTTENVALVPEKLSQQLQQVKIKSVGKAAAWSDFSDLTGMGNTRAEAIRQFGVLYARKLEADLIAAAGATVAGGVTYADGSAATSSAPLAFSAVGGLTWDNIVDACALMGDAYSPEDMSGLYLHTVDATAIKKDDDYIRAQDTANGNVLQRTGVHGYWNGLAILPTDLVPAGSPLILANRSLGFKRKKAPEVEGDRDILLRNTTVAVNAYYAVCRIADRGVVKITVS